MMLGLVIEKDESLITPLASAFSRLGMTTIRCDNVTDALARVSPSRPDLFVLRWSLSSGVAQCEELRSFALDAPILIAMRRAGPDERATALDAGADSCIEIPFNEIEIRAKVLALLRRRERRGWEPLPGFKLDQRSAWIAGRPVELTRREHAIVKALARRRGATVPRRALLAEALAIDFDPGTNVLDVHISHIRKKLRAARAGFMIQSVRGVGYRIQSTQS